MFQEDTRRFQVPHSSLVKVTCLLETLLLSELVFLALWFHQTLSF